MDKTVLTIGLGLVAGLFGGTIGASGIELMLPGLLILGIVNDYKMAVGTVLTAILAPLSIGAVYVYYKRKQVVPKTALLLIISYAVAAYFSAKLAKTIPNQKIQFMAAFYFLSIGLFMLWNAYTKTYGEE